mmetsp:Transcript_1583/g.4284  ORF Transcript_1583/g.4284 Transcript_1583/m.4284 type:complete len:360 (+) Transcript_1583:91-1170(+)
MSLFSPMTGIIGGTLIGGSAGILMVMNGDIMGISGILSRSLGEPKESIQDPQRQWRWVFIASFATAVNIYVNFLSPAALHDERATHDDVPIPSIIGHLIGGFLVGVGTKIGNGCTTGHGICGMGRLSPRSLASVVTFTGSSIITTYMLSPVRSWSAMTEFLRRDSLPVVSPLASALVMGALTLIAMARPVQKVEEEDSRKSWGAALSGMVFAAGLAVSGMTKKSKVHDFLCFSSVVTGKFDPTLVAVLGSGIVSSWASYQFISGYSSFPSCAYESPTALPKGSKFGIPTSRVIDSRLIVGAMTFGIGWGVTGICPGPGLYAACAGIVDAIVGWIPSFLVGSYVGTMLIDQIWEKKEKKA